MFCFPTILTDEHGKDQGINIRQKVKELVEFAQDDDRLREERKKAKKNSTNMLGFPQTVLEDLDTVSIKDRLKSGTSV